MLDDREVRLCVIISPLSMHPLFEEYLGENDNGNIRDECKCRPTNDFKIHMEYDNYIIPPNQAFGFNALAFVRCVCVYVCGGGRSR